MSRIPSLGLIEILIIAGLIGLVLIAAGIVVAIVVRKKNQAGDPASAGSRLPWKWIIPIALVALLALPILALVLGVLAVTPVRRETGYAEPAQDMVAISDNVTPPTTTGPAPTPDMIVTNPPQFAPSSTEKTRSAFLSADNGLAWFVILLSIAGLVLLIGSVAVALVLTNWEKGDPRSREANGGKWAKLRYVLLVLLFWFALGVFLILDFTFAVSIYGRFVIVYAAFWALIGALLLWNRPGREKGLILALFVLVLFSVRFVDWHSRKPFLKDLYSIKEGMTPAQVDRIMDGYMRGTYGGPPGSDTQYTFDEQGQIVNGAVTFRHTDEGWGDSDWGRVTFRDGRVSEVTFLPD
ncbi:MAG: hypothetical protein JXA89_09950 [Anaerolineae bacterium]|nr:hypothetical protein [Anaerolineae bacterium]